MSKTLKKEHKEIVELHIKPIMEKYEMITPIDMAALIEAFTTGMDYADKIYKAFMDDYDEIF